MTNLVIPTANFCGKGGAVETCAETGNIMGSQLESSRVLGVEFKETSFSWKALSKIILLLCFVTKHFGEPSRLKVEIELILLCRQLTKKSLFKLIYSAS